MVRETFRVPLYGQNGKSCVAQPFDHVISRAADRDQSFAGAVYGLVMGGIYRSAVPVELIKEITASQVAVIYIVKLIASDPFVDVGGGDVLCDAAAEMDVDKLQPFADTEHGLFLCHKTGEKLELKNVKFSVHVAGAVIRLTEKGGRNVSAAGEKQMGGLFRGLRTEGGTVGDTQPFQRFFVVFCIFTAACDNDRGKRRHGDSFLQSKKELLYLMREAGNGLKNFLE